MIMWNGLVREVMLLCTLEVSIISSHISRLRMSKRTPKFDLTEFNSLNIKRGG